MNSLQPHLRGACQVCLLACSSFSTGLFAQMWCDRLLSCLCDFFVVMSYNLELF